MTAENEVPDSNLTRGEHSIKALDESGHYDEIDVQSTSTRSLELDHGQGVYHRPYISAVVIWALRRVLNPNVG